MHRNFYSAIERGETNPTYTTLLKVARALGRPLHEIIAMATAPQRTDAPHHE